MFQRISDAIKYIGIIRVFLGLVAPVSEVISWIETLFTEDGKGQEKKAIVMDLIEDILSKAAEAVNIDIDISVITDFASSLIDFIVKVFNVFNLWENRED